MSQPKIPPGSLTLFVCAAWILGFGCLLPNRLEGAVFAPPLLLVLLAIFEQWRPLRRSRSGVEKAD